MLQLWLSIANKKSGIDTFEKYLLVKQIKVGLYVAVLGAVFATSLGMYDTVTRDIRLEGNDAMAKLIAGRIVLIALCTCLAVLVFFVARRLIAAGLFKTAAVTATVALMYAVRNFNWTSAPGKLPDTLIANDLFVLKVRCSTDTAGILVREVLKQKTKNMPARHDHGVFMHRDELIHTLFSGGRKCSKRIWPE